MARKKASLGCLFWLALILLVVVVFLFNRTTINRVIESTGFMEVVSERLNPEGTPAVERSPVEDLPAPDQTDAPSATENEGAPTSSPGSSTPAGQEAEPSPPPEPADEREPEPTEPEPTNVEVEVHGAPPARAPEETERNPKYRKARVYFITVDGDGHISLKGVIRNVEYLDSPLTQTINILLRGPTPPELNQGLLTLIPEGSKLISATVRDGTAVLNFSEAFRYNALGIEGSVAQLKQIVYSATEFSTVERVQILVQGRKHDYLNGDGVYVGKPIARNAF
jgi:spore germination protein GerM